MSGSEAISPTAHYTGHVWVRNGLSHPGLATVPGRVLFESLQPANRVSQALGGPTLEGYLLARHRAIDARLTEAIERHGISQVLEVAAGLSPRGWRFAQRYGEGLTYVEADLPDMAARKRRALAELGSLGPEHRVVALDALRPGGEGSVAEVAGELDPARGLAIITEGLLGYLPTEAVLGLWARFAAALERFERGRYLSDLHLGGVQTPVVRGFRLVLSAFVRGRVHLHFDAAADAERALVRAGFRSARVLGAAEVAGAAGGDAGAGASGTRPAHDSGSRLAHIIEASSK
ncbi:MAG TPA: class I SAM-dependent methyltransferase [Solirubrobacteraceae bacterium]|nr:class I SAM-dependent methyltransferase [Solirubrobacteraceae bacterium]